MVHFGWLSGNISLILWASISSVSSTLVTAQTKSNFNSIAPNHNLHKGLLKVVQIRLHLPLEPSTGWGKTETLNRENEKPKEEPQKRNLFSYNKQTCNGYYLYRIHQHENKSLVRTHEFTCVYKSKYSVGIVCWSMIHCNPCLWEIQPRIQITGSPVLIWAIGIWQDHHSSSHQDLKNLQNDCR